MTQDDSNRNSKRIHEQRNTGTTVLRASKLKLNLCICKWRKSVSTRSGTPGAKGLSLSRQVRDTYTYVRQANRNLSGKDRRLELVVSRRGRKSFLFFFIYGEFVRVLLNVLARLW